MTQEKGVIRPAVVAELSNAIIKKVDHFNRKQKKTEPPLNMSEVAAGLLQTAHFIDSNRGGMVVPILAEMLHPSSVDGEQEGSETQYVNGVHLKHETTYEE